MKTALIYPFDLIIFWYHDVCLTSIDFFIRFNSYFLKVLSTPILIKTFFKPLKNEYRKGLVLFSIVFGIIVKTFLVSFSLSLIAFFIFIELFLVAFLFLLPFLSIYILYAGSSIFQII